VSLVFLFFHLENTSHLVQVVNEVNGLVVKFLTGISRIPAFKVNLATALNVFLRFLTGVESENGSVVPENDVSSSHEFFFLSSSQYGQIAVVLLSCVME